MSKVIIPGLLLSLTLIVSCGGDNDDNNDSAVAITPPVEREEESPGPIRYSAIGLETSEVIFEDWTHSLRMDFNRRPLIITGNFSDSADDASGSAVTCNFQLSLTDTQAQELENRADKLKLCSKNVANDDIIEDLSHYNLITLTNTSGGERNGAKNFLPGSEMDQTWICQGKSSFYSYVKKVVGPAVPANCPAGALNKF